jgi:cold shock CspA family protein
MKLPLEITYRGVRKTEGLEDFIRRKASKLDQICDYITSCRVAVEVPQRNQRTGNPFRVRIQIRVPPGHELVAKQESSQADVREPLTKVLSAAFESAARRLRELVEKQRGEVKMHFDERAMGVVVRLFPERGYGFLKTLDTGKEVYFHRNSVVEDAFDRLEVGTGVRFVEQAGTEGPQASTVAVVDKARPASGR